MILLSLLLLRITEMKTSRSGGCGSVALYLLEDWWRRKCSETDRVCVGSGGEVGAWQVNGVTRMRHRGFYWHWCGHLPEQPPSTPNTKVVNRHQLPLRSPSPTAHQSPPAWQSMAMQVLINDNILVPQTDVADKQKCANIFASGKSTD